MPLVMSRRESMGGDHIRKVRWWIFVWISVFSYRISAQVKDNVYFLPGNTFWIPLTAPPMNGTEFNWMWTSHKTHSTARVIATCVKFSDGKFWSQSSAQSNFLMGERCDIFIKPWFKNAGVFSFAQIKPTYLFLTQTEVFAVRVEPFDWSEVPRGSDVSLSCEVSRLPESATLQWEKEGNPTANTTLLYNNTAYIILHSVHQHSRGEYNCSLTENGQLLYSVYNELDVTLGTKNTSYTLYRESSNSSKVSLVCRGGNVSDRAEWYWSPNPKTIPVMVASAERDHPYSVAIETDGQRFTSQGFGEEFILCISPVKFEDSGSYGCYFTEDNHNVIKLTTVRVSAEPPGGVSRNQTVVLTCEVSEVTPSATLAWLRMEGSRGVLVKQEVLTESHPNRKLSVTLPSLRRDQLHWECAVFTESMLRARASLSLTLITPAPIRPLINTPNTISGMSHEMLIRVIVVVGSSVGMLGVLWYCWKRPTGNKRIPAVMYENIPPGVFVEETQRD